MSRAPVNQRIEDALQLQPMTVEQLAICLMLDQDTVRKHVRSLRYERRLWARRHLPTPNGRPWLVYGIRGHVTPSKNDRYARDGGGL